VLALLSYVLAPGGWVVALLRQLAPTPANERIAKADLARQLPDRHQRSKSS
jgi:UDP-N-acetyl-D-mannosaminuronic acid transferase (WecB/TagA/CpsF family)